MSILQKGHSINDKYQVTFFLKKGSYAETYRVKDKQNNTQFLKLFSYSKLHRTQFDQNENIVEIEIIKHINHPNIVKYCDSGDLVIENKKYAFVILDFISGETLADKMKRDQTLNPYGAKYIIIGVLKGLNYLHNLDNPIIHNEITNLNIMTDLSEKVPIAKIIDFGYSRYLSQSNKDFMKEGLNPLYLASETFNKVFSVQSDVFSVGALYYHLLFGLPPWFVEIPKYKSDTIKEEIILEERRRPLKILNSGSIIDEDTINIIEKALQSNTDNRFKTVEEFLQALNGEIQVDKTPKEKPQKREVKEGKGFSAIAGMQELKNTIQLGVIDALNDKERYKKYGLTIPNGMLLYGPPGCGKTFFAEKMAEEIGFNFRNPKPSDILDKWVNGTQENIKKLFDEARENAPTIIFLDELDALVPNRDSSSISHMNKSAVNEFLAQMNNCGENNVFVIGATNRPNSIDPAILRAGRLDEKIYVPPPDFDARKLMFKLYLKERYTELGLNYKEFATATKNYISSDIKLLCNKASITSLKLDCRISDEILLETIKNNKPSISLYELKKHEDIKAEMEGETKKTIRKPIGF